MRVEERPLLSLSMIREIVLTTILTILALAANAQVAGKDTLRGIKDQTLKEVTVGSKAPVRRAAGAQNATFINRDELFKAACCNLGESFTTNPSVDVNYSDAATGARQIRLLGLSGTYVQMLTENIPNFRGASMPYSLGYVAGTWMKSLQVSKGNSSVRNGYEAMTGQINVQYLQPEDPQGLSLNVYGNTRGRLETNLEGNYHFTDKLSSILLGHFENEWGHHDQNHDGFMDMPRVRQYNFQNRWAYLGTKYIMHAGATIINEDRMGGQLHGHASSADRFAIGIKTKRYEGYMKHAFVLNPEHGTNIALMAQATMHEMDAGYGYKGYSVNEKELYSQLMFEHHFTDSHELSVGLSFTHDYFGQTYNLIQRQGTEWQRQNDRENVIGAYAQYTYNLGSKLTLMAGVRADHSNLWGTFVTPRLHAKWMVADFLTLRGSIGKGSRTAHVLAENNYLMASGRQFNFENMIHERAWNYGLSAAWLIPLGEKTLKVNTEYYYTNFGNQAVIDYDANSSVLSIHNLDGRSYSHTFQIDASVSPISGMDLLAAWRWNDVKTTYGGVRMRKPLQSKYKGLLSFSFKPDPGLWQFDINLQLNGGGRMPSPYTKSDGSQSWKSSFKAYEQLSAQVTRHFRHFSVYIGGEDLTNFRQHHPIIDADNPFSSTFEPTLVYGPVMGIMGYLGVRINLGNRFD